MKKLVVALMLMAACGGGGETAIDATAAVDAPATDAPVGETAMVPRAAAAICGALYRCCDDDLADYFAPYRADERLVAFRERLPPAATLDQAGCEAVMSEMLDVVYLGEWARAIARDAVELDAAGFGACEAALDVAACGAEARAALWDSTCFGLAPPGGGTEQRRFARRTATVGAACAPIKDGVGSAFYGTCDPTAAFCCYQDPARPGCQFPFTADGAARPGTCAAVAARGAECSPAAPLLLCATGDACDAETARCAAPVTDALAVGAACVDGSFNLLGTCTQSWCDLLGSGRCEPLRADGATCTGGDECGSGYCQGTCQVNPLCTGVAPPVDAGTDAPMVDAGTDAPMIDAPMVDAPMVDAPMVDAPMVDAPMVDAPSPDAPAADGERCTSAFDLLAASSPSPMAGYTHRIAAAFAASNDYNPLQSSMLPPSCSVVYDARGKEKVYAITLGPGDRLRLRATLADGRQAGIYLLDTCPGGSWPDLDGTGACGSNEYNAGFCGPIGCDAATLDIRYPATIGGQPAPTATFWVVVDQVGGDDSTGFVLDWQRITP